MFNRSNDNHDSEKPSQSKNFGFLKRAFMGSLGIAAVAMVVDGWTVTQPDEVRMLLRLGDPVGFTEQGFGLKRPLTDRTFSVQTSLQELELPASSVALQNGTITAENIQSSVFIKLNGTRAEMEETVAMMRQNIPAYETQIISLAEGELRDTVRLTSVASAEFGENQEVTQINVEAGEINFLDTDAVGDRVAEKLQGIISGFVPGTVEVGDKTLPRLEISEFRIGNFEFDADYLARRETVADSRALAEAARFKEAEAERIADATAAQAEGDKRAAILRAEGDAQATVLRGTAEATALQLRVEAAGGAESLREQTLAESWNGETPRVVGGTDVIVDDRYAPGVNGAAAPSLTAN